MPLRKLTTKEQADLLAKAGIDVTATSIDWAQVFAILSALITLFSGLNPKTMGAQVGCDEGCAADMKEAVCHNLKAADLCLHCCCADGDYAA